MQRWLAQPPNSGSDLLQEDLLVRYWNVYVRSHSDLRIDQIVRELKLAGFTRSSDRIRELLRWEREEGLEEGTDPLSLSSVKGFQDFIQLAKLSDNTLLGVFPKGTLCAEWRPSGDKHLLVDFLDEENIGFASRIPSDTEFEKMSSSEKMLQSEFIHVLDEMGVDDW